MKQMNNSKKVYMVPMLEVMNARVEKGFAGSGDALVSNTETVDPTTNPSGNSHGGLEMD